MREGSRKILWTAALLFIFCWSGSISAAEILKARTGLHNDKTRFVLDLSTKPDFSVAKSKETGQVVIRLKNISLPKGRVVPSSMTGLVKHTMFVSEGGKSSRVILFLKKSATVSKSFYIPGKPGKAHRLVVDLVSN